jgi:hypothetical protein
MRLKIDILREYMNAERWEDAIKFAAKFPQLGDERNVILSAKDAINNPGFYRQIKKDPAALIEAGRLALLRRYPQK